MTSTSALEVLHEGQHFSVASFSSMLFVWWGEQATAVHVGVLRRVGDEMASAHGTYAGVHIVRAALPLPDRVGRELLGALSRDQATQTIGTAVVLEAGGFWASAVQSLVTGLSVLSSTAGPTRIFREDNAALDWLLPRYATKGRAAPHRGELENSLTAFRKLAVKTEA